MEKDTLAKLKIHGTYHETYNLFLQLNVLPKSLNKKLRSNRWRNNEENRSFDMLVACEVAIKPKPPGPLERAKITIVRHSYRTLDYDGLVGSLKPVVDALVSCGVLIDDNWKVTGKWDVDQKFRPKKDGPLLEIFVEARHPEGESNSLIAK